MERKIGFIGAGAMAEAIINGLICSNFIESDCIYVSDVNEGRLQYLAEKYLINTATDNTNFLDSVDVLVIAVKPQIFPQILTAEFLQTLPQNRLIVSIMGSISLEQLQQGLQRQRIVRTMPNTPLAVGAGMTAITATKAVSAEDLNLVKVIFATCGEVVEVAENQIEAVTALSGCGPGYVFMMIDALADAGVMAGLSREMSIKLAAQTFYGAGKMLINTNEHPAVLRDKVTSPAGTTIAGIRTLEKYGVRSALIECVASVLERSKEIMTKK